MVENIISDNAAVCDPAYEEVVSNSEGIFCGFYLRFYAIVFAEGVIYNMRLFIIAAKPYTCSIAIGKIT